MFKRIFITLIVCLITVIQTNEIFAQNSNDIQEIQNIQTLENIDEKEKLDKIYSQIEIDEIISKYSDRETLENIKDIFSYENISNQNGILSVSPGKLMKHLFNYLKKEIKQPFNVMMQIIGIVLISAIAEALKMSFKNEGLNEIVNCVSVLCVVVYIATPLNDCINGGVDIIINISKFIQSFIPVYAGVITSCGMPLTGGVYNIFLFFICQFFSHILSNKLLPIVGIYMSFCLVGSMTLNFNVTQVAKGIKNIITWVLCFINAAFVGLITVQGVVAASADTMGTKAAKFVIGSTVPVIGNVISDAYTSIRGCFNFIRTGLGAILIVFVVISFLPILIKLIVWIVASKISATIADFIGLNQVSSILKSSGYAMDILMAIVVSYIMLMIIITTLILMLGMGFS